MFKRKLISAVKYLSLFKASLSPGRLRNLIRALLSLLGREKEAKHFPIHAQIEPTSRCNLSCALCPIGAGKLERDSGDMLLDEFKRILRELRKGLIYLSLYNLGEPFLHPDIFRMIRFAKSENVFVRICTNGWHADDSQAEKIIESGIDELVISLDCATPEKYREYKGADGYEKVISNIRRIVKKRGKGLKPFLSLQMLLTRQSEEDVRAFKRLARELKVDRAVIRPVRVNYPGGDDQRDYLPVGNRYMRKKYYLKRDLRSCSRPWLTTVILWDGSVVPCCFDMQGEHIFGNARQGLDQVWNNHEYKAFREQLARGIGEINICRECSLMGIMENLSVYR